MAWRWKWKHLIKAVGAAAAVVVAATALISAFNETPPPIPTPIINIINNINPVPGRDAPPQLPTDSETPAPTSRSDPPAPFPSPPPAPPPEITPEPPPIPPEPPVIENQHTGIEPVVRLGPGLRPSTREDCRNPTFATGSAWQVGWVKMSGRNYENAFFCNLFSSGVGSLDFVLGRLYRELRVTIGIADDSGWLQHHVRFEIIGDDRGYLADPVALQRGETRDLKVNVMDILRLKLKITELSSGASDSPSKPVWANPIVVPLRSHTARATRP